MFSTSKRRQQAKRAVIEGEFSLNETQAISVIFIQIGMQFSIRRRLILRYTTKHIEGPPKENGLMI